MELAAALTSAEQIRENHRLQDATLGNRRLSEIMAANRDQDHCFTSMACCTGQAVLDSAPPRNDADTPGRGAPEKAGRSKEGPET